MSELVEIVARALCERDGRTPDVALEFEGTGIFQWMHYQNDALAALRAIEGAGYEVGPGWQPIETAPRDGSYVLLTGCNGTGLIVYGAWIAESPDEDFHGPGWSGTYEGYDMWVTPTHWRPLPGPPAFDAAPTAGGGDNG